MKYISALIVMSLILMINHSGCITPSSCIEGKYYSEVNPSTYLELQNNNQFVVNQETAFSGQYTVSGNILTLIYTFGSFVLVIDGDILTDEDGERWIKR